MTWIHRLSQRVCVVKSTKQGLCRMTRDWKQSRITKTTREHSTTKKLLCMMPSCRSISEPQQIIVRTRVAALAVLMSSQVLQATPHIVGFVPSVTYRALHFSVERDKERTGQHHESQCECSSRHQIPRLHEQPFTTAFHICDILLIELDVQILFLLALKITRSLCNWAYQCLDPKAVTLSLW